jgi:fatty-acyl-CoA synthase
MALQESYWPADTSEEVREATVASILRDVAARHGSRTALVAGVPDADDRRRWTFAELLTDAEHVAQALLTRFEPGEHVAVWAPNVPEWILLQYGAGLAGLVLVTVNPAYQPAELEYVLRHSRAAGVFLLPDYRGNPMAKSLDSIRMNLPDLRDVVLFTEWDNFVTSAEGSDRRLPEVRPDDAAMLLYTSGTTGFPKGALLHHRGVVNDARLIYSRWGFREGQVMVSPMPLFHVGGCVIGTLGALTCAGTYVPVLAFDPALMLELVERERAAFMGGVPTMLIALMEHPDLATRDISSLEGVMSGGAPVPAELVRRIESTLGVRFTIVFGQTECSAVATQTRPDDTPDDKAETVGQPLPQIEVKIVDPVDGTVVPPGELGELCIRGFCVMKGYYEMPDANASTIDGDGWLHTGDLGTMDDRGYCRIQGRLKDMIIRGGENIYPREIEAALYEHPAVADVAVVGVPDERWGEQVVAFLRLAEGQSATPAELSDFVRQRLAAYKAPRSWVFVDAFPLTGSGKVQKYVLRQQYEKGELESR